MFDGVLERRFTATDILYEEHERYEEGENNHNVYFYANANHSKGVALGVGDLPEIGSASGRTSFVLSQPEEGFG